MLKIKNTNYNIKTDIEFIMEAEKKNFDEISKESGISRTTLMEIFKSNHTVKKVHEKIYSYIYNLGYRLNSVKEDFLKESNQNKILFHGAKHEINEITSDGSRINCDFGKGFYTGETYDQALSFVCENKDATIYSFECDFTNLNIIEFNCSIEWMLAICYYRGTINNFSNSTKIKSLVRKIENCDIIIAPIADNRMFYIMSLFANGDINSDVALHSLSASKLGQQYIFKSEKALNKLKLVEQYYLCEAEKEECIKKLSKRALEIETKLKLAKREFRDGLYIEELLK